MIRTSPNAPTNIKYASNCAEPRSAIHRITNKKCIPLQFQILVFCVRLRFQTERLAMIAWQTRKRPDKSYIYKSWIVIAEQAYQIQSSEIGLGWRPLSFHIHTVKRAWGDRSTVGWRAEKKRVGFEGAHKAWWLWLSTVYIWIHQKKLKPSFDRVHSWTDINHK